MTKMKKLFAVVLALAMLFTMASFSASATEGEPVSLTVSSTEVNYNGGIRVTLNVDESRVGGVQTTITYNQAAVKLAATTLTNSVNKLEDSVLDDGEGKIKVIVLNGDVIFDFAVLEGNAATSVNFAATEVKASNLNGDGYVEVNDSALTANVTISTEKTPMPVVIGSRLRETKNIDNLHLGFDAQVQNLPEGASVTEVGLIVIPTAILTTKNVNPEDFTLENTALEGKVALANLTGESATEFTKDSTIFTGYIKKTASAGLMGKSFTARYYIKVDNSEEKIYSNNFYFDKNGEITATYGTAKKSAVKLLGMYAKQIATNDVDLADDAAKVIADYNAGETGAKQALIEFVFNNRKKIK